MTKETMTIHRALAELKVIDSRIEKMVSECTFATINKHCNTKIGGLELDAYRREQEDRYKSACDLIERRNAIKRAVVQSNAKATVLICGKQYTVAEAIDTMNNGMDKKQRMLNQMAMQLRSVEHEIEVRNGDELQRRADEYIRNMYGSQTDLSKLTGEMRADRENFIAQQRCDLVTPMGMDIYKTIRELDKEIEDFWIEVDAALSVSNATTTIEIEY